MNRVMRVLKESFEESGAVCRFKSSLRKSFLPFVEAIGMTDYEETHNEIIFRGVSAAVGDPESGVLATGIRTAILSGNVEVAEAMLAFPSAVELNDIHQDIMDEVHRVDAWAAHDIDHYNARGESTCYNFNEVFVLGLLNACKKTQPVGQGDPDSFVLSNRPDGLGSYGDALYAEVADALETELLKNGFNVISSDCLSYSGGIGWQIEADLSQATNAESRKLLMKTAVSGDVLEGGYVRLAGVKPRIRNIVDIKKTGKDEFTDEPIYDITTEGRFVTNRIVATILQVVPDVLARHIIKDALIA